MKKIVNSVITIILLLVFTINVNAAECSYEEQVKLNDIAATVKATYEEIEIDTGEKAYYVNPETDEVDFDRMESITLKGFKTSLLNLTEDVYAVVTNDLTGESKNIFYSDTTNGTIYLDTYESNKIVTYTIKIYGSNVCSGMEARTITLITPRYNKYSELTFCDMYPNFELCVQYSTGEEITFENFMEQSNKYQETNPIKEDQTKKETKISIIKKIKTFIKNNKTILIIIGSVVVIAGVATTAIIVVRRRSRLI